MGESAWGSFQGPRSLELDPNMVGALWDFDMVAFSLLYGLPRWMMANAARKNFDWDGLDAEPDWEEHFGARTSGKLTKYLKEAGFTDRSIACYISIIARLRLHFSMAITRETTASVVLEGHKIPKGSFVQDFTGAISHLDETIWAKGGHPAAEFWGGRHFRSYPTLPIR
ncbi:hypothetical protein B0T26DRAFT_755470 [Lasiosphaeria miniovina]|uniref:Uncharacterized protein n=1 Tax=Lasiosphaeria miniovina TaxID=1954250 RepID=A0AA39ZYB1_9PEZI|nr:uncharacterized protein B0T26DRAFT_755470 [Lasiosphaeria miniovina]KAK0705898.1 hypothetical protein B0T26DRAFT_755470 [Lasiosphaeria miniovina]